MNNENPKPLRNSPLSEKVVIILVLAALGAIVMQNHTRAEWDVQSNACINNLRRIDAAANEFALVNHLTNGDTIRFPNDLTPYIKLNSAGKIPTCPSGGTYHLTRVGDAPVCSLSNTVIPDHILP
jgi:hypothetical protein